MQYTIYTPVWGKKMFQQQIFQFIEQKAWIAENFPKDRRFENLILESENILTAETVKYVGDDHGEIIV